MAETLEDFVSTDPPVAHRLIWGASSGWPMANSYPAILRYSKISDLNPWGKTITLTMKGAKKLQGINDFIL